jgi:spermidine/putrescine transport system permease protein
VKRRGVLLRAVTWLVYAFLYAPIAILVLFSFNATSQTAVWQGFTLEWYRRLLENELILSTVRNSLIVGAASTLISTVVGTLVALALGRYEFPGKV